MGMILIACASLGLLCVAANLLEVIGKIVVTLLKYVVCPIVICILVMFIIYCMGK